jgi:hypothetical protein
MAAGDRNRRLADFLRKRQLCNVEELGVKTIATAAEVRPEARYAPRFSPLLC